MLIRFVFENFRSFKEESVFEMLATSSKEHSSHIINDEENKPVSTVRIAAMYGANASGKSNVVSAMSFAQDLIVDGTKNEQRINVTPFRLDKKSRLNPSKFEFTFKHLGVIYIYGFILSSNEIIEEWLFVTPKNREVKYFERVTKKNKVKVEFGDSFVRKGKGAKSKQFLDFVAEGTRPNQLFLTEAVNHNVERLKPIRQWFTDVLQIIEAESHYGALEIKVQKDKTFTGFLGNFLESVGTGIEEITTEKRNLNLDTDFEGMDEDDKRKLKDRLAKGGAVSMHRSDGAQFCVTQEDGNELILINLKTKHVGADQTTELFDVEDESDGTQRLMHLVPVLFSSKYTDNVYVIDELDRRLHPLLSQAFLRNYLNCAENRKGQLIFTTHDTNLLDAELLRNDEVWFVEKNNHGASKLYSLAEFKLRQGLKIEKGYLNGRFGAIPFISELNINKTSKNGENQTS